MTSSTPGLIPRKRMKHQVTGILRVSIHNIPNMKNMRTTDNSHVRLFSTWRPIYLLRVATSYVKGLF